MLVCYLDGTRGDVDRQVAELGRLLERLGARYPGNPARQPGTR